MKILNKKAVGKPRTAHHGFLDTGNLVKALARLYQDLFNNASDAIFIRDLKGNIINVNKAALTLTGYTHNELTGMNLSEFLTDESFKVIIENQEALLKDKTTSQRYELDIIRKDRVVVNAESRTSLLTHNRRLIGVQCIVRDITKRKQAEKLILEERNIARKYIDIAGVILVVINADQKVTLINKKGRHILGYGEKEIIGKNWFDTFIPERSRNDVRMVFEKLIAGDTKPVVYFENPVLTKSGEERIIAWHNAILKDKEGKIIATLSSGEDVTQRKRAEEELQIAEQNFRNSLDNSPLGIRIVTAEGELLYANQAILDIYGYSSIEELKNTPTKQRYTPESYAEHQERTKRRKLGEPTTSNYEVSIVRKDGEVRHLAVFRKEVMWGSEIQFQALYLDITEHKRTQEALKDSEQKYKTLFENLNDAVFLADVETGLILDTNGQGEMLLGRHREEIIGMHQTELHPPEMAKMYQERFESHIKKGHDADFDGEVIRKDGAIVPVNIRAALVTIGDRRLILGLFRDITESKRSETALRQSEEFTSSLLTNSPSPIIVLNADASIRYVNPAMEKLSGFSSEEVVGSKPPYLWWRRENHKELSKWQAKAKRRGSGKGEYLHRKKNGDCFWVETTFRTVKVNGEFKYYLFNWVDLTEQKRLKANMESYLSQVTRAQEGERKRIAREIHDESIQSLSNLALNIDSIVKNKRRLPEDIVLRLERLRSETNSILNGLRRFSHELRPGVIDQVGLVPALEILIEELNKEHMIKSSLEIRGSERRLKPETELALFRIAQEAIRNIRTHSRATKAAIRVRFTESRIKLVVSDNGRGFDVPDMLSTFPPEGKLGLIGMQERTRLLGGKFSIKSQAGKGTTLLVEVIDTN